MMSNDETSTNYNVARRTTETSDHKVTKKYYTCSYNRKNTLNMMLKI